ncbi:nuclear transport factor 2 family protein [Luteimonas sp. RC10]|uniref:nuclear transport factor 2 family protein n=1 Tax=Luteimonas sp. RC10 TaxID=2587035 RepID=UPI001608C9E8|nr:nuclear transport factor 2 family protein [Luteimonas sp. RC10]MBB3343957.1 4-oxalocrotonate tautomerase [Luteimonas sp. RC10]
MSASIAFAREAEAIADALARYFDGLHHSDVSLLAQVFHPQAHYFSASDGHLLHLDMTQYFPIVAARPSPASQGHARTDRIVSLELAGPVTALAKVTCSIPPKAFIDLLTLVKLDGQWRIVSKVFHHHPMGAT